MSLRKCKFCKQNKTHRLVDVGEEKKIPVCTDCFVAGKHLAPKKYEIT